MLMASTAIAVVVPLAGAAVDATAALRRVEWPCRGVTRRASAPGVSGSAAAGDALADPADAVAEAPAAAFADPASAVAAPLAEALSEDAAVSVARIRNTR